MSFNIEIFKETRVITKEMDKERESLPPEMQYNYAIYYTDNTVAEIRNNFTPKRRYGNYNCQVKNVSTLQAACDLSGKVTDGSRKVLILNFANAMQPGGGVRTGANAQEEDLCRKSTLYGSLISNNAAGFYDDHIDTFDPLASDAIIISPNVRILRNDDFSFRTDNIEVAAISCAAPIAYESGALTNEEYENLLFKRIMGIICVAAELEYDRLVLGAWGCGAFGNDAEIVAKNFYKVLHFWNTCIFEDVVFAILDNSADQYNIHSFMDVFSND